MSMLLTDRQKNELHGAILEYFMSQGDKFANIIDNFKTDAGIIEPVEGGKAILEKKWTSIIRLQKKIDELEAKLKQCAANGSGGHASNGSAQPMGESRLLPKPPAKSSLTGHRGPVTCVACHPVFSLVASGSEDATIRIWDHETGQYERTLKGHTGTVTGVAFDTRGSLLASCSADMSAKLWDTTTFQCTKTLKGHDHTLSAVRFLPSADQLLTCSRDATVKCWEVSTGYCVRTFAGQHSDWVKAIAVSLDGLHLASAGSDQAIVVWQVATGQVVQTLRGHEHVIETLCYGKRPTDAAALVAAAASSSSSAPKNGESPAAVDAAGEYSYLASGSRDRSVKLWDALRGVCLATFAAHENWVRCVVFHPTFKYLLSCSDDKTIRVMDIKEGRCMRTIADAHGHFVTSLAMSAHYPVLISGSVDKNISLWACS